MPDYALPVDQPQFDAMGNPMPTNVTPDYSGINPIVGKLFGVGGNERFQTWPERMVRSGSTIAGDVFSGAVPIESPTGYPGSILPVEQPMEPNAFGKALGIGNFTIPVATSEIGRTQDLAGLITLGGIVGTPKGALGTSGSKLFDKHKQEMMEKYGNNGNWVSKQSDNEFAKMKQVLEEDKSPTKLIPVKDNPFAELEAGIADTVKNLPRERRTNSDIIEEVPTQEIDKIHNIALSFVDRWNPKAREKRAEAQGFEQDAYHGTKHPFKSLNIEAPKGYGFYSTANPELAEMYAGKNPSWQNPNIIPLKINTKEYNVVNADGKSWTDINDSAIAKAMKEGKKGVVIHNVYDEPASGNELGSPKTVFISLDPTTVKSKFAKFNLEKLGLNDLLASGAALLLGGAATQGPKLVPVDHDPHKMTPVDGNPFL